LGLTLFNPEANKWG